MRKNTFFNTETFPATVTRIECNLRTRRMPNGYKITISAVHLPDQRVTVYGASACAPDDRFDLKRAEKLSMKRARQQADLFVKRLPSKISLLSISGRAGGDILIHASTVQVRDKDIAYFAETRLYDIAAFNAEAKSVLEELETVFKRHPMLDVIEIGLSQRLGYPIRAQVGHKTGNQDPLQARSTSSK